MFIYDEPFAAVMLLLYTVIPDLSTDLKKFFNVRMDFVEFIYF